MLNALYSIGIIALSLSLGYGLNIVIPGLPPSLFGMIIFTLMLHFRLCQPEKIKASIIWGIRHMGVCFVPAGVGIINHFQLLKQYGLILVSITLITTLMLLTLIGYLFQRMEETKPND